MMRLLAAALALMVLSACSTTSGIVPNHLLTCQDQPRSPAKNAAATDRDGALYFDGVVAAGDDCRKKLGSVRRILYPES